jgi:dUTPase
MVAGEAFLNLLDEDFEIEDRIPQGILLPIVQVCKEHSGRKKKV